MANKLRYMTDIHRNKIEFQKKHLDKQMVHFSVPATLNYANIYYAIIYYLTCHHMVK